MNHTRPNEIAPFDWEIEHTLRQALREQRQPIFFIELIYRIWHDEMVENTCCDNCDLKFKFDCN